MHFLTKLQFLRKKKTKTKNINIGENELDQNSFQFMRCFDTKTYRPFHFRSVKGDLMSKMLHEPLKQRCGLFAVSQILVFS